MLGVQYDRLVKGGEQILEQYGAFTDPHALPMRSGILLEVYPQDVMAGALQDAALSHMADLTSDYVAASHQLGAKLVAADRLGGPDLAGWGHPCCVCTAVAAFLRPLTSILHIAL